MALNGSTYALPLPSGRGLAVSRLSEGFAACSDHECTCTFNCTGFSAIAYQAFSPPTVTETGTHYLLYASPALYLLEKPKPGTAPQNGTQPNSQTPANATTPQNNTSTTQPPTNTTAPQSPSTPQDSTPANNTPPPPQNPTASRGSEGSKQDTGQDSNVLLAIPVALLTALALLG